MLKVTASLQEREKERERERERALDSNWFQLKPTRGKAAQSKGSSQAGPLLACAVIVIAPSDSARERVSESELELEAQTLKCQLNLNYFISW